MEEKKSLTQSTIMKAMDWAYDKAMNGVPGLDSAEEMAADYLCKQGTLRDKANSLIRRQNAKAGTSGFLTGIGGLLTMPVAIPANITSVLYVQIRMIAAIAIMGGYNLRDDRVKSLVYVCLVASSTTDVVKKIGIEAGQKLAVSVIKNISAKSLREVSKKVGFKLLTKFGEKGVVNLGRAVPFLGGIIGGAFDVFSTNTVGNVARDTFLPK